jgi:hypothetical protein
MDTHWGKYQGPLAAVTARWLLDGDWGDEEYSETPTSVRGPCYGQVRPCCREMTAATCTGTS